MLPASFHVTKEWLDACIQWCKEAAPSLSGASLQAAVKEQWLLTDIRGDGIQAKRQINSEWKTAKLMRIDANLHLQLLSALDIAQSAYSQLQAIMRVDTANANLACTADEESFRPTNKASTRMLKLVLTDGFCTIEAIEHEPLNSLQTSVIKPGLKLQLVGPMICRKGVILLKSSNLRILGGSVEEMEDEFATKAVLAKIVGTDNVGQYGNSTIGIENQIGTTDNGRLFENNAGFATNQNTVQATRPSTASVAQFANNAELATDQNTVQATRPSTAPVTLEANNGITSRPFTYLSQIPRNPQDWLQDRIYVVKACVASLADKLTVHPTSMEWHVSVILTDGTESKTASLSSALLTKWIGATPKEYGKMSQDARAVIKQSVIDVADRLQNFNGLVKLARGQNTMPIVVETVSLNRGHLQQLKVRSKKNAFHAT